MCVCVFVFVSKLAFTSLSFWAISRHCFHHFFTSIRARINRWPIHVYTFKVIDWKLFINDINGFNAKFNTISFHVSVWYVTIVASVCKLYELLGYVYIEFGNVSNGHWQLFAKLKSCCFSFPNHTISFVMRISLPSQKQKLTTIFCFVSIYCYISCECICCVLMAHNGYQIMNKKVIGLEKWKENECKKKQYINAEEDENCHTNFHKTSCLIKRMCI